MALKLPGGVQIMCRRFALWSAFSDIERTFGLTHEIEIGDKAKRGVDVLPTEKISFIAASESGRVRFIQGVWGLVPWWAKQSPKDAIFEARAEIVDTSRTFKDAWATKRCLIPANGFYACSEDDSGNSWFVHLPGGAPFAFAGLWAHNKKLGITSCALITLPATGLTRQACKRMPALLSVEAHDAWLDPATAPGEVKHLLDIDFDGELEFHQLVRAESEGRQTISVTDLSPKTVAKSPRATVDGPISTFDDRKVHKQDAIQITSHDRDLFQPIGIMRFPCAEPNCNNTAFWGFSQSGHGPRRWFCNEHRDDGLKMLASGSAGSASKVSRVR